VQGTDQLEVQLPQLCDRPERAYRKGVTAEPNVTVNPTFAV
jgi:hypothetical protein